MSATPRPAVDRRWVGLAVIVGVALPQVQRDLGFTLAGNVATELTGRAVQGAGAALIAPSALT